MIKGHDLIVLSDDWGRHPFSCQHIIKHFLPFNRVIWVNTIGYRSIQFNYYDFERAYGKITSWLKNTANKLYTTPLDNPLILNPVCVPFGKILFVRSLNTRSVTRMVRKAVRHNRITDPIVITTLPTAADFVGNMGEQRSIYYCVDDFTQWPGVHGNLMQVMEKQLLRKVDLVIASSEKLQRTRNNGTRKTLLLTHGVDVEHFRSVAEVTPSRAVKDLMAPIVAYYGLIDERCNFKIIRRLAAAMPGVTFLIIGQWRVDPGDLARMANIHIIGPVPYNDLPAYLSKVDALILPYIVNDLADSINPLKLKEYIATGLPIVATPLPEVVKLERFVRIANGYNQFHKELADVLTFIRREDPGITAFLHENSWEAKAEEFSAMIEEVL